MHAYIYIHIYLYMHVYLYIYTYFSLCIVLYPHGAFPVLITPLPSCRQETVKVAAAAKTKPVPSAAIDTKPVPSAAIDTGDGGSGATEDWAATASPCSKLMNYAIPDGPSESAYISISHEHRM